MKLKFLLALCLSAAVSSAQAVIISIDFDTAATGSGIIAAPLVTAAGTVTASASEGSSLSLATFPGGSGDGLRHGQTTETSYGQLAFDFNVSAITFIYAGFVSGDILVEALDLGLGVVDSFFDGDTNDDLPGGPVTLSGAGIRFLRFSDTPSGGSQSGIDSLRIVTASVPEPGTVALLGLGLLGIARRATRAG